MEVLFFTIKNIKAPALNILKQDALSVGADIAVPKGVVSCEKEFFNALLIGTKRNLEKLAKKEKIQPFGLKELAKVLENSLNSKIFPTQIMGVLNSNSDSFFKGSHIYNAQKQIEKLIEDGADIIDIGAVSSRPNAPIVSKEDEEQRLEPIFKIIKNYKDITFSIDSYTPNIVKKALDSGFTLINDITGAKDENIILLAKEYNSKLCIMHMQGTPQTMQNNPYYEDVTDEVSTFFTKQIEKSLSLGLNKSQLILDVGIGFGKRIQDNLELIKNLKNFTSFNIPLLIGASRKSIINSIFPSKIDERLAGTLSLHLKALENGASILRCHDVYEHKQALEIWKALN